MSVPIEVRAEPIDDTRCRFVLSRAVGEPGEKTYTSESEASDSPVAEALLEVPGIVEVTISGNEIIVVKDDSAPFWTTLEPEVRYAVNVVSERLGKPAAETTQDGVIYSLVETIFKEHINPALANHGGLVELVDVQDGIVVVRMMGGCQGCGMARVTLRQGVEATLRKAIPAVQGVRDITDHASGARPYFASGKR